MKNPNFLILDEPTNDLDIITLNVLEEFLLQFEGCLIIISHDRYMIDKLVDHLFVFEGDGVIKDFPGGYTRYRNWKQNQEKVATPVSPDPAVSAQSSSKTEYEKRKEIRRIEQAIEKLEQQKKGIQHRFLDQSLSLEEVQKLHLELQSLEAQISEKEATWMELADDL